MMRFSTFMNNAVVGTLRCFKLQSSLHWVIDATARPAGVHRNLKAFLPLNNTCNGFRKRLFDLTSYFFTKQQDIMSDPCVSSPELQQWGLRNEHARELRKALRCAYSPCLLTTFQPASTQRNVRAVLERCAQAKYRLQHESLSDDIVSILRLQGSSGQWRLSKKLYHALGHTCRTIPLPPPGVKDGQWATALAIIYLRRRPDLIDHTYHPYSRAIPWVDEPLLAEAHKRLPPANLYFNVEEEASRQGRWQEHAAGALEECRHTYFLQDLSSGDTFADDRHSAPCADSPGAGVRRASSAFRVRDVSSALVQKAPCESLEPATICKRKGRLRRRAGGNRGTSGPAVCRDLREQSRGLRSELSRAVRAARTTFREGDRIESRWRRPTSLDRPQVDPNGWYPGRVISVDKRGKIDMVFEDGAKERLSCVPVQHIRLAPSPFEPLRESVKASSCPSDLSSATRRKLTQVAASTSVLRCSWEEPLTMDAELVRLRGLWHERMRGRPEWQASFPRVNFQATKKIPIGARSPSKAPVVDTGLDKRGMHRGGSPEGTEIRSNPIASATFMSAAWAITGARAAEPGEPDTVNGPRARGDCDVHDGTNGSTSAGEMDLTPSCTDLARVKEKLVAAAFAYEKCVATVRDCLARGSAAFSSARTYAEQQKAFEEATANLGPGRSACAGYTDWRGTPVVGLQSATLDAVEAMVAWAAAREKTSGRSEAASSGTSHKELVEAPLFLWDGAPLVSTVIGHSAKLLSTAPELAAWFGPNFPLDRNPFFLAYPIDERPPTPRSATVQSYVNGEIVTAASPMLTEEREAEEAALHAINRRQDKIPSWWPGAREGIDDKRYQRLRQAEKFLRCEERRVLAKKIGIDERQ